MSVINTERYMIGLPSAELLENQPPPPHFGNTSCSLNHRNTIPRPTTAGTASAAAEIQTKQQRAHRKHHASKYMLSEDGCCFCYLPHSTLHIGWRIKD